MKEYTIEKAETKKLECKLTVKNEYLADEKCYKIVNDVIYNYTFGIISFEDFATFEELQSLINSPRLYNTSTEKSFINLEKSTDLIDAEVVLHITQKETAIFIYEKDYIFGLKEI